MYFYGEYMYLYIKKYLCICIYVFIYGVYIYLYINMCIYICKKYINICL